MKNLLDKILILALAGGLGLLARAAAPTMFVDSLELKVGNTDEAKSFEGLPVLVKVFESDEKFPGFSFSRSGGLDGDGSDIRFSQDNVILPHEMLSPETDADGKKILSFWVRVPKVTKGSKITMHWGVKDGLRPPANRPSLVWSDYLGVWHHAGLTDKTVKDVSGNNRDASRDDNDNLIISGLGLTGAFTISGRYKGDGIDTNAYPGGEANIEKNLIFGNFLRAQYGWGADVYFINQYCGRATSDGKNGYAAKAGMNPNTVTAWHKVAYVGNQDYTYAFYVDDTNVAAVGDSLKFSHAPNASIPIRLARAGYSAKEIRLSATAFSLDRLKEETAAYENENYVTLADGAQHVVAAGENYWLPNQEPTLVPLAWSGDLNNIKLDVGKAMFGGPSPTSFSVQNAAGTKTFPGGFADLIDPAKNPDGCGAYRVVVTTAASDDEGRPIKQLTKVIYFAYVSEVKSQNLSDDRIMLFNDLSTEGRKIVGQGFGYEDSKWSYSKDSENNTDENHLINTVGWRIRFGTIGNTRLRDAVNAPYDASKNYLPCGAGTGALVWNNPSQQARDLIDGGSAILYNYSDMSDPAAVYSPCYENGVGEVYFDAVNMDVDYINRLELQYLTLSHLKEKTHKENINLSEVTFEDWASYKVTAKLDILPIKEGTKASPWTDRPFVPLMMMKNGDGANTSSFYRVRAKLNKDEPIIFRIARTDSSWGAGELDGPGNILVDNILVSEPTTVVKLQRLEDTWNPDRDFGKFLHGDRGTLTKRFPKVGDENVRAQVRVSYEGFGSNDLENRTKNVAALIFKYRRRYLKANLGEAGVWKSVRMECASDDSKFGSIFMTPESEPLDLGEVGEPSFDLEYAFEYTPNPTSYDYVDYFGLTDCAFESASVKSETLDYKGDYSRTPTLGTDFFIRLREGSSDYEQMEVLWKFQGSNVVMTNNLHIVDDHLWTGAVAVTNANTRFAFKMRGVNKNAKRESGFWQMDNEDEDADDSPYSTIASELKEDPGEKYGFKWITADVVKNTRQFIFRFNDETGAISVCRGDYQDFNNWTDAAAKSDDKFVAHAGQVGDDGKPISDIASSVLQRRYPSNPGENVFNEWTANKSTDSLWNETFFTTWNAAEEAKTGVTLFNGVRTPNNGWLGRNFMLVNESLNNLYSANYQSRAALLEGRGRGSLECDETTLYPDGIGKIEFDARLGQQHSYDRVSTYRGGRNFQDWDYLVSTRVVMSSAATSSTDLGFDGQGTASIFAYYDQNGSYEFRMKRLTRDVLELGLYRWYQENGVMKAKELYRQERKANGSDSDTNNNRAVPGTTLCTQPLAGGAVNTTAYVAFLSVKSILDDDGNVITNQLYAGFTNNNGANGAYSNYPSVATDVAGREMTWHSFYVRDAGITENGKTYAPLENGTFGFLSTDCPARFMRPQVHDALDRVPVRNPDLAYIDKITLPPVRSSDSDTYCIGPKTDDGAMKEKFRSKWNIAPSAAIGTWTVGDNNYYGVVTPDIAQEIAVSTRPLNDSEWSKFKTIEVSSFNYSRIEIPAYTTDPTCVKLATVDNGDDSPRCDVILDNISMTQWHASTDSNIPSNNDQFVFTGVWTEETDSGKRAEFWPLRVSTNEYQTVRSPFLESGIGAISFSYDVDTLDENAELAIEYVMNGDKVGEETVDLYSSNVYRYTNEKNFQKYWTEYKVFDYDQLVAAGGHITEYLGRRGEAALIRLRVPQTVITAAHNNRNEGEYGRIDLKSIAVWDEPNVDERSWTAWNVRVANANTAANEYVSYDKLLNIDSWLDIEGKSGMSMELNNGAAEDLAEYNPDFYGEYLPYIQSPALTTPEGDRSDITVGEISFRARKSGMRTEPAVVEIFAVKSDGTLSSIATTNLTTTAWQNITIKNRESNVVSIRLVMQDYDDNKKNAGVYDRAVFDELSVTERVDPNVVVTFARPFRNDLNFNTPVATIALAEEQPLCGEEWGIQCELALKQLENVIIPDSIEVWCDYYIEGYKSSGMEKWGYSAWEKVADTEKRGTIKLTRVSDINDNSRLVYRMVRSNDGSASYIAPIMDANTIVQYNFRIHFRTTQEEYDEKYPYTEATPFNPGDPKQWTTPEWYYPVDFNKRYKTPAAYTIIDKVAPKRAWINEVNVWDSKGEEGDFNTDTLTNTWVEIAIPSGVDMTDWRLEAVSANNSSDKIASYNLMSFGMECESEKTSDDGPFAFYVVAHKDSSVKHDAVLSIVPPNPSTYTDNIFYGANNDRLSYLPYALRLVRPTGVVDHEIIVGGRKSNVISLEEVYEKLSPSSGDTGHNKVVIAGLDNHDAYDSNNNSVTLSMLNVANTTDLAVSSAWNNAKSATPGALNVDQSIDDDYLINPNDDTLRIDCVVSGVGGISQDVGNGVGLTNLRQQTTVKKDSGEAVKILYKLDPWYEIDVITTNGVACLNHPALDEDGCYEFTYTPTANTKIEAVSRHNEKLTDLIRTGKYKDGNPYEDAILAWMRDKYPDVDPETLKDNLAKVLNSKDKPVCELTLTEMYWIGAAPGWALRCYISSGPQVMDDCNVKLAIHVQLVKFDRDTNTVIVDSESPRNVQSLASKVYGVNSAEYWKNRDNNEYAIRNWTNNGPTLQILASLNTTTEWGEDLSKSERFLPTKFFILNSESFEENGEREIVIPDPFGPNSVTGGYYNWQYFKSEEYLNKGNTTPGLMFNFDLLERVKYEPGYSLEMLK